MGVLARLVGLPSLGIWLFAGLLNTAQANPYTLEAAVDAAQRQDPWLLGSVKRQRSLEALGAAATALPDPTLSLGLANLPVDSFDVSQEMMTQFKVGFSQLLPRGNSRALKREKLQQMSSMQHYARADRRAQVAVSVAQLWLDAYANAQSIQLIKQDRALFEHLVDLAESRYISTSGATRQQDLVRAQLELTRLDDRLIRLYQQRDSSLAQLGQWLDSAHISLAAEKPLKPISLQAPDLIQETDRALKLGQLADIFSRHPKIKRIDQKIKAFSSGVMLARQNYKPQWALNASYGYRDETPLGDDRPDFFSVGVSVEMPLFGTKRQDKTLQSANAELEAVKTERQLALRQLRAGYETTEATHRRLIERKFLFDSRLIKEMTQQAEAAVSAYTNDHSDFAEVVRARIAELNARIEALHIDTDMQKNIARLNYYHAGIHLANAAISQP